MLGTSAVQVRQLTNQFGPTRGDFDKPKAQIIREMQMARNEAPCFGTDKRHDCAEMCEWRRECREPIAAWLR